MAHLAAPRRRDKPVLSCTFCRGRKLRCDRQSPCGACVRRERPTECVFTSSAQERRDAVDYRPKKNDQARQRIARLETLVTEMRDMMQVSNKGPDDKPLAVEHPLVDQHDSDRVIDDMGKLSLTDDHAVYVGSAHWETILEDIHHLRDELSTELSDGGTPRESTPFDADPTLGISTARMSLLNHSTPLTKEQILVAIPVRSIVDRLVSHFFNAFDGAALVFHQKTFLKEYANFWVNPSQAPIMWVGLLFAVMSVSATLQRQHVEAFGLSATTVPQDMVETYRMYTIHCMLAGDYLRAGRYAMETLLLHHAADHVQPTTDVATWAMIGVTIRVAFRMGLHRDPSHWPNIRPLQAEYRRRIWTLLYQVDFFTSTQVGLPRIIKESQYDVRPPRHLLEDDLDTEHDELPPERPLTDHSHLLFVILRHPIIKITAEIYDATETTPPSSATIAFLATKLEKVVDAIPSWLKHRPLEVSLGDDLVTILQRMFIDILVHKATYLLHRRSFLKRAAGGDDAKSNEQCISAALAILDHQRRIGEEVRPGGLMFHIRWKVASSLNHEFLQATMMLCFALSRFDHGSAQSTNTLALHRRNDILNALLIAKSVWESSAHRSTDAQRAAEAIESVLKHDFERSTMSPTTPSEEQASVELDQPTDALRWETSYDHWPGLADDNFLGDFDYANMPLDPPMFATENEMASFGSLMQQFGP